MTIMAKRAKPDADYKPEVSHAPMKEEIVRHEDGAFDPRHSAAQDVLMAIHEKSPMKLMEAMSNFHELHAAHKNTESADE